MKRLGIVLLALMLLVGCGGPRDLRVPSDSIMEELLAQPEVVVTETWGSCEMRPYVKLKDMAEAADCVIVAEVEKIWYEQRHGDPVLQLDVIVQQNIKGKLRVGDRLSMDYPGGYITYREMYEAFDIMEHWRAEYENMVSKTVYEGMPWPEEGNQYVLYMNKSRNRDSNELYELTSTAGILCQQEDGTYIQQGTEDIYTIEEIKKNSK